MNGMFAATLDGGVGYVLPVSEKVYRRLLMLQNVMNNYCCHIAGLNPRAFRYLEKQKYQNLLSLLANFGIFFLS